MNKHHREVDADIAAGETKIVGTLTGQPLGEFWMPRACKKDTRYRRPAHTRSSIAVAPDDIYAPGFVAN